MPGVSTPHPCGHGGPVSRRPPDTVVYRDCAFVITLINHARLSYGAGSHLHVDHGELTAVTAAGEERRVLVQQWQDVIINAGDIVTNRWRRPRPVDPASAASPQPPTDDNSHRPD